MLGGPPWRGGVEANYEWLSSAGGHFLPPCPQLAVSHGRVIGHSGAAGDRQAPSMDRRQVQPGPSLRAPGGCMLFLASPQEGAHFCFPEQTPLSPSPLPLLALRAHLTRWAPPRCQGWDGGRLRHNPCLQEAREDGDTGGPDPGHLLPAHPQPLQTKALPSSSFPTSTLKRKWPERH